MTLLTSIMSRSPGLQRSWDVALPQPHVAHHIALRPHLTHDHDSPLVPADRIGASQRRGAAPYLCAYMYVCLTIVLSLIELWSSPP